MGTVVVFNNLTLDGVMQSPGRPDEDLRGGFPHGSCDLNGYHLFHAIRADLLRRIGRNAEAAAAYDAAIARCENTAERDFLRRRRQALA
jgi:hypothetical protein